MERQPTEHTCRGRSIAAKAGRLWRLYSKMRCLELFAGTGSIGRAFEQQGWEVVSLDICPKFNPTHVADVLSWNFRIYKRDHFRFVWASPVCTQYSIARTTGPPRDLLSADRLVERAMLIMTYFRCHWAFEKILNLVS